MSGENKDSQNEETGQVRLDHRSNRSRRVALIAALAVVVLLVTAGLTWAFLSNENQRSRSTSSSLSSSDAVRPKTERRSGVAGQPEASDAAKSQETPELSGQSDQLDNAEAPKGFQQTDQAITEKDMPKHATLPKIGVRAADRFAKTEKMCGPGKPFSEDNVSQESLILEENNRTLTLLSGGKSDFHLFDCVVRQLGIPDKQAQKMASRTVQPGLHTFDFNGLTARWSFTSSGLDLYITQKQ